MSSRAIAVVMLLLPLMMTISVAISSSKEMCLRQRLNPSPPPPLDSKLYAFFEFNQHVVCKSVFRVVGHALQMKGSLPMEYVLALCDIFGDNELKVRSYVTRLLDNDDFHTLAAGRSCATIRSRQRANPHDPSLW